MGVFVMKKFILSSTTAVLGLAFLACSSNVKKADIPTTANPQSEINRLEADIQKSINKNIDVLAASEFKDSVKWKEEAKSDLASGESQEEILNDLRTARGFLEKAYRVSENREAKAPGLFQARQAALQAGAQRHPELRSDLADVDSEVSNKADRLVNTSADQLALLQNRYMDLERRAVVLTKLGKSQAMLNGAQKDRAEKLAPTTFKKSELSLNNAEALISANVRSPEGYSAAVTQANADAELLFEVMKAIKQNNGNITEGAALRLVSQNRQIKNLKTELATTETTLQDENQQLATELSTSNRDLSAADKAVGIQQALEKARSQFSPDEAEAYQQGENLVIRMKKMKFASGRSDLPASSLPSLAKVLEVAKELNAESITVEGHTDSTGARALNQTISEERAGAVASYFKTSGLEDIDVQSSGFGFEKPISTNKSKEGRAQNRRVDIIITPATM